MIPANASPDRFMIRTNMAPGDLGCIIGMHGIVYAQEQGFDMTFEAYVAGPLAEFVRCRTDRDRLWIVESGNRLVGCVAIVGTSQEEAQLRWFLVDPSVRGLGLGKRLLQEAIAFCKRCNYGTVFLWTVSALTTAAQLYRSFGFEKVEETPGRQWGVEVIEEKYVLVLK